MSNSTVLLQEIVNKLNTTEFNCAGAKDLKNWWFNFRDHYRKQELTDALKEEEAPIAEAEGSPSNASDSFDEEEVETWAGSGRIDS